MKEITTGIYQLTDEDLDRIQESVKFNVEEVFGDKADKLEGYRVSLKPLADKSDGSGDDQGWTPHIIRTYGMEVIDNIHDRSATQGDACQSKNPKTFGAVRAESEWIMIRPSRDKSQRR